MCKIQLQPKALEAISKGIEEGHSMADLEEIGALNVRTINLLEREGILTLEDLMNTSQDKLFAIPHFGIGAINNLLKTLNNYHTLELVD